MSAKRVVVTGLGATSPVGGDVPTTWSALLEGRSGVASLTQDWAEQLGARIAAEVAVEPLEVLDRVKADVGDIAKVEMEPNFEGRQVVMVLAPR